MASHQTTSSYLRNSVFDVAFEIGLVDPSLSNWLEDVQEVAEEKTQTVTAVPSSSTGHEPWISSPDSELSHSSTANTLTTITSNSSQGSFQLASSRHHPNPGPPRTITTPRAVLPDKLELKTNATTSASSASTSASGGPATAALHSSPFVLPLQPLQQKRSATKLLKKGRSDKKGSSREKDQAQTPQPQGNATETGAPVPYSFLQHEPTPPPSDHEKNEPASNKGFFGRLRDRSRSKSRAARKPRPSDDVVSGKDSVDVPTPAPTARGRAAGEEDRAEQPIPRGRRPGAVTVQVDQGLPQLQLDPLSNRKSADLLTALSAEFSLVAATAQEESDQTKKAIEAYYAGVMNPPPPAPAPSIASSSSSTGTVKPAEQPPTTADAPFSSSQPIPRPTKSSVMDRPHPKVRTSGFWANKDRGVMVVPGGARSRVARKASASRRASVRGAAAAAAGVRRVPSHKRKASLTGGKTPTTPGAGARRLSINGLINAIREEGATGTETTATTTDFEEIDTDSDDDDGFDRPSSLPWGPPLTTTSDSDAPAVPAIPVIIERRPSTKSTRSSKPNLSLTLSNLVPGSTPTQRLSPSSPMRSPGSRFRRSSHGPGLPSPLKPPPTSPLPPTPTPSNNRPSSPSPSLSNNELVVVLEERPQSGIVTPTAAKAVLASMPSPRQSDWFEEDDEQDSDVDMGRRTPFSRTPEISRPASPSDEWIVPTPTSVMTAFQAPIPPPQAQSSTSEFSKPIPRPLAGRAPATPEARARATASAAMSRTGLSLIVPPNGIPAKRPGTSPQPTPTTATGRTTPGHLRNRPGEAVKTAAPPPSTWNPPTSALTRISSMKSQRGRQSPSVAEQQQPQQQQPQAVRSHSRDDSNGSSASQRGRMSPFPVRPSPGSRDVSPLPSLKRTPSKMSTRQRTERVRSFHAEVGGDFDADVIGRQSGESVRSGESEGWATASNSTHSSHESARQMAAPRPRNYNDVPRDMYMPSPNPMSAAAARRPGMHSRGPSPLPPMSATLPLNPSPHRIGSPSSMVSGPRHPALRPSASFTVNRPQQMSASTLAPSSSLRIDRNSRVSVRSVYSTTGDLSDDDDEDARSFRGLSLDDEDRPTVGKGFDVIAARLGDPSSKSAKLLQRLAVQDAQEEEVLPPKGRGSGMTRANAPSLLKVPQRPMTGPNSPNLSPRLRHAPTPTSAGGARWI